MRKLMLLLLVGAIAVPPTAAMAQGPRGGGNGRILISPYDAVFSIRPDGTGRRLIAEGDYAGGGRWSPDKSLIGYTAATGEDLSIELHVARPDGRSSRVAELDGGDYSWSWSPDGSHIAYIGVTTAATLTTPRCFGIIVVDVETLNSRPIADAPSCDLSGLAWSPAGKLIAFVDGPNDGRTEPGHEIFTADVRSGTLAQLTDTDGINIVPAWSPDGSRIAFASSRHQSDRQQAQCCSFRGELYVMRRDGSRERRLTQTPRRNDIEPTWSPDGRLIAWTSQFGREEYDPSETEARVMLRDGSSRWSMTNGARRSSWGPEFSPDGRWLVFSSLRLSDRNTAFPKLLLQQVDGSHRRLLYSESARADW